MLANSVPLPGLGERFTPTRPGVRTGGAEASNCDVCGSATSVRVRSSPFGTHRKPAHALEATTSTGPMRRDPQRVGRITTASGSSPSSRRLTTTCPSTGCRSIHVGATSTAATSSTRPSESCTATCHVVASPSRIAPWPIEWCTSGKRSGRSTTAQTAAPTSGVASTSKSGRRASTAITASTAPPNSARACAVVGRQRSSGFTTAWTHPALA